PPIANRFDGAALRRTVALVAAARPSETHLLLPADADPVLARRFVSTVSAALRPSRILLTEADRGGGAAGVGLSLASKTPISYLSTGAGLVPAEPDALARMVLA